MPYRRTTPTAGYAIRNFFSSLLGNLVSVRGGGTPAKGNPFYWSGPIPWVTPKDMKVREIHNSLDHISSQAVAESSAKLIDPGAVLVVVRGMILVHTFPSAILRAPAAINQDMKALVPKPCVLAEFLTAYFWAINDRIVAGVSKSSHDTRKLETDVLMAINVPVPPLDEQMRIITAVDTIRKELLSLRKLQDETAVELDALMPSILDCAFRGEL